MKKRGTSKNVATFPKGATATPDTAKLSDGLVAVMLTLMSDADRKTLEAKEAEARVQEYAGQIVQMSGLTPAIEYCVNWNKKIVEKIPKP